VICHDTCRTATTPDAQPAICRGFADRYATWRLNVIARLFGFVEVAPPSDQSAPPPNHATT
jgi:hypothetical protein